MNLQLDWMLMGHDMPHIDVIDTAAILRGKHMTHSLHLNSGSKMRLTHFIAEKI
jgi:hypothetical protein